MTRDTLPAHDPVSVAGKSVEVAERVQLLVIGGGPAGLAAATEGARLGLSVILVDENPVSYAAMGDDVPLHFGQAMSAEARNRNAVLDRFVASEPAIEAAFEAGVDVRLGTACWGLYVRGPSARWLPDGVTAGLVEGERSWMIAADRVVVATGRRDMGLAFPGWEMPGIMGATAAVALATRYGAFAPRNVVVLGATTEALHTASALVAAGVTVAAIIEQAGEAPAPAASVAAFRERGTEILTRHVVREAVGRDGVEAVMVSALGHGGVPERAERRIDCDGVVLAVAAVAMIDLLDALGCAIAFQPERGGHAPLVDADQHGSLPAIFAVGDCAGIWPEKSVDRTLSEREARRAAAAVARDLGLAVDMPDPAPAPIATAHDPGAYRLAWVRASVIEARGEPHVCQCEEVTAREILEVRPPRYLAWNERLRNDRSLSALIGEGPPDPDQIKRLTRAGMGPCQGRRCREQVAALLALEGAVPLSSIPLATHRAPVRPLPLGVFGLVPEAEAQAEHWDTWFGMHAQWRPFWEVPERYTVATNDASGPVVSE
jgi:thioredoxin reductase